MNENLNLIERYFSGALQPHETTEFEQRRETDKQFAEEVLLYQQATEQIRESAGIRMKHRLDELGRQRLSNTVVESYLRYRFLRKHWLAMAASVLIVIGLGYLGYRMAQTARPLPTMDQLYAAYYEVPSADLTMLRGDQGGDSLSLLWNEALRQYRERQFAEAGGNFRTLLHKSPSTRTSVTHFYLGVCYLSLNLPDSALSSFKAVSPASSLYQDALWYSALGLLKAGRLEDAREAFDNIASMEKHYRKKEAKEISMILSKM